MNPEQRPWRWNAAKPQQTRRRRKERAEGAMLEAIFGRQGGVRAVFYLKNDGSGGQHFNGMPLSSRDMNPIRTALGIQNFGSGLAPIIIKSSRFVVCLAADVQSSKFPEPRT